MPAQAPSIRYVTPRVFNLFLSHAFELSANL
jgi:hypothetical protein